jgi:hypothetical protein
MFKTFFSRTRTTDSGLPGLANVSRRKFLGVAGAATGALAIAACGDDDDDLGVDLGSGDVGVLNYAYALEQLEAAFYVRVIASPYSGITAAETSYLTDIRDHEVAHREFFKAAITAAGATPIPGLDVNFSSINFAERASVLNTAMAFEDLGVSAYNGAGRLITNGDYLVIAGKIVSVEARHAALIRDLLTNNTFANTTDSNGLDPARTPTQVLDIAKAYINTKINASNLPTS